MRAGAPAPCAPGKSVRDVYSCRITGPKGARLKETPAYFTQNEAIDEAKHRIESRTGNTQTTQQEEFEL